MGNNHKWEGSLELNENLRLRLGCSHKSHKYQLFLKLLSSIGLMRKENLIP